MRTQEDYYYFLTVLSLSSLSESLLAIGFTCHKKNSISDQFEKLEVRT